MAKSQFDPAAEANSADPLGHALDQDGLLIAHDEDDGSVSASEAADASTEGEIERLENAAIDNVLDELVDVINARDYESVAELFAKDSEAPFLNASSAQDIAGGLNDLLLRYPSMVLTRGELGNDPVIGTWLYRQDQDQYTLAGYLTVLATDDEEPLIERIELVDELDDDQDLVVERPEPEDISEWQALADRDQF